VISHTAFVEIIWSFSLFDLSTCRWVKRGPLIVVLLLAAATAGCRQGPWDLWNAYSAHFINEDGRVVEHSAGDRTTSEGQSYALFFALADNDRARFDKILSWSNNNLAAGDMSKKLPGWQWGKAPDGQWKLLDTNPASDADCWFAYTLIEAGRLWKNPGYSETGRQMLALIAKQEVADLPGFGSMLMPGNTADWVHNNVWTLNPSYLPLFQFQRFAEVDPAGPWGGIAMNIPRLVRQSSPKGFAMDWVNYIPNDGFYPAPPPGPNPPPPQAGDPAKPQQAATTGKPSGTDTASQTTAQPPPNTKQPMGSYDAIRVYMWAGMVDGTGRTREDLVNSLSGMGGYLSNPDRTAPPEKVSAQGIPEPQDGPVGFEAALLPYLWVRADLARVAAQQRVRMSAQRNPDTGLYGKQPVYYDQNLVLFAIGYLDSRFRFGPRGELKVEWTR
jgi:endoglucanase